MFTFYLWPWGITYMVTTLITLCVLSQASATVISFFRYPGVHPRDRVRIIETLLELFIIGHIIVCSLLHGHTREGRFINIYTLFGHEPLRVFFFLAVAVLALAVVWQTRKVTPLLAAGAAGLTLPIVERLTHGFFAYIYILALLFWLTRSIIIILPRYKEIRTGLSALSVKNAIDTLHTGVLFHENNGNILLVNAQMQLLMTDITGKIHRNGREFYELLTSGKIDSRCTIKQFEGQNIIILPNGSAWKFSLVEIQVKRKKLFQLTAADISEQWKLTSELQSQNEDLLRRQNELHEAMANLHIVSREKQTQSIKMRTHDILSEPLSLMLQAIRNEQTVDYSLLKSLSTGMIGKFDSSVNTVSPQKELNIILSTFGSFGVEIQFDGALPPDDAKSRLFVDIAREAITNAVRHGFATRIFINAGKTENTFHLCITDNGYPPSSSLKEGGGITGIRQKLIKWSGNLTISVMPAFTLTVTLPEGDFAA